MKIALEFPGSSGRISSTPMNTALFQDPTAGNQVTAGAFVSRLLEVGLYIGGILMFVWAVWGVFDYIKAEGNKEGLAKARKKIQWAIIGFVILLLSFFISDFLAPIVARGGMQSTKIPPLTF